ncbi:MAG: sulfatase-like hydrolase/transferase, partial [Acidobacteriota bacterium]
LLVTGLCLCLILPISAQIALDFIDMAEERDNDPFFLAIFPLAPHVESCDGFDPDGPAVLPEVYKDLFRRRIRPPQRHESYLPLVEEVAAELFDGANPLRPSFNERFLRDKSPQMQERLEPLDESDVRELVEQFAGRVVSLMAVDDLVGDLVKQLTLQDEINDTIILLTSDNGWQNGEHRMTAKGAMYEESARVPLYARVPDDLSPRESSAMVLNTDLAPTLAAIY